jgi:hypothetical protein
VTVHKQAGGLECSLLDREYFAMRRDWLSLAPMLLIAPAGAAATPVFRHGASLFKKTRCRIICSIAI